MGRERSFVELDEIGDKNDGRGLVANRNSSTGHQFFEDQFSWPSRFVFWYMNALIKLGYSRPLELEDLPEVADADRAEKVTQGLIANWKDQLLLDNPSIFKALFATVGRWFLSIGLWKLPQDCLIFIGPIILQQLLKYIDPEQTENAEWTVGLGFVAILFVSQFIQSICLHRYFQGGFHVCMHTKAMLAQMVYRKALYLSNQARQAKTTGEIVNLMAVDSSRLGEMLPYLHNVLWSSALQITVSVVMLYGFVQEAAFAGLAVMLSIVPLNAYIVRKLRKIQEANMKVKDARVKTVNELLQGIRVVKYFAWEGPVMQLVHDLRNKEVAAMRKYAYLSSFQSIFWNSAPVLVSIATFAVYTSRGNELTLEVAFPVLAVINIMRFPLNVLPFMISGLVSSKVSLTRVGDFLKAEELKEDTHERRQVGSLGGELESAPAVEIKNGCFQWVDGDPTLKNITASFPAGKLTAVVGSVGSGKSSLLGALLGEMEKTEGRVSVPGNVVYAPQQAWIQNCTLKDNIIFGANFDSKRYAKTIHACALQSDLDLLDSGDNTEIGERGINLSGGQKQRVNVARAVYNGGDVYMFDDPLSAVDSHVGKHIFNQCFLKLLKNKTRILVTHKIDVLPKCDHIIVMDGGRVKAQGTYDQLQKQGLNLSAMVDASQQQLAMHDVQEEVVEGVESGTPPASPLPERARSSSSVSTTSQDSAPSPALNSSSQSKDAKKDSDSKKLMTKEERNTGAVGREVYMTYFNAVGSLLMFVVLLMGCLSQTVRLGTDWWVSYWSSAPNKDDISFYLGVYGIWTVAQALVFFFRDASCAFAELRAASNLHNSMLASVMAAPMAFFDTTPMGRILNRFSKDQEMLDQTLPRSLNSLYACFLTVAGTLLAISAITPTFIVGLLPLSMVYFKIQDYYRRTSRELKRIESVSRSPIYSHFSETLNGLSTIRAYGLADEFLSQNGQKIDLMNRVYLPNVTSNRWLGVRLEFCGNIIVTLAALSAVTARQMNWIDHAGAALIGLSMTFALSVTNTLGWMVRMSTECEANMNSVERVEEYSKLTPEAPKFLADNEPPADWPSQGRIDLDNVVMAYRPGLEPVLRDVSLSMKPGHKIGICGRTGAGKSSIIVALFRIAELESGSIKIDGVNISKIGLHTLRSRLSIVPQDPVLFTGTVRYNLDPFKEYKEADLWDVLEQTQLRAAVERVGGLDCDVTEGGENFSAGERQLFCMARALLRRAKVIVLDEATAAVDMETDDKIQKTIRDRCTDTTVVTIAHRINTIMDYNTIVVMDAGRVKEVGSPQELLQQPDSSFAGLVRDSKQK